MRRLGGWVTVVVGVALLALGLLWLLQGTGLVVLDPVACVGECEPVRGPEGRWAALGATLVVVACAVVALGWRWRSPSRSEVL